ncbi:MULTISPECIES: dihydroorotase [unclassified Cyanobium]|uniref:dihydroorotase n=1 Tax=unclassified Cyanobium TaxID=2627006 RepID=UPI0020CE5762|nr:MULTISPECIES: dihydroorotase [unclassified Cyanobium]MCP9832912.1 dihydroorotase [Cyanobium sp. La Preciosa 7G6]MCP9935662.1 dihydroorotase [Cyanobium sp. Aljojuca 7A6]
MVRQLLIRGVTLLEAPGQPPRRADVLLEEGALVAIDPDPAAVSGGACATADGGGCWLGPALVDPHSVLEEPLQGQAETLASLGEAAASGGYGTVALLPWAPTWRDRPERLRWSWPAPLQLLVWGSFSVDGLDRELAPHADQLAAGACGLAAGASLPPIDLLERGLRLAEMGDRPVLLPPRDGSLAQRGFVRERVEALRAGWPLDPPSSETLPLETLLTLAGDLPDLSLRLMQVSTAEAVARLRRQARPPMASVGWWHLVADSGGLDPADDGWLLEPALGGPTDRRALIEALADGVIGAVAVHHVALDAEEELLPLDQRRPGVAGHGLVLPLLWEELVGRQGWQAEQLWQALCWGPARFLGVPQPALAPDTRQWLLFDPGHAWRWDDAPAGSLAANRPCRERQLQGRVIATGLTDPAGWVLAASPPY